MKKYAVVGEKLAHTMSPIIHQLFFDKKNIEASYDVVEIPKGDFANCRKILLGYDGVNVTVPYKQEIIKYLDEIDDVAMQIGAVNTIVNRNGKLCGFNTDVFGFKFLLEDNGFDCKDKSVAVLGSGGASKAIVFCLLKMRAKEIFVVSRDVVKAEKDYDDNFCKQDKSAVKKDCCDDFDKQDKSADKKYNHTSKCCLENCNLNDNGSVDLTTLKFVGYEQLEKMSGFLIVNTTPIGMFPNDGKSPIAENITKNFEAVCDIVYNPSVTKLCFDAVN
ncbi:MAG: shikimate dehydrogenase, partial [Clostridia bacterium]